VVPLVEPARFGREAVALPDPPPSWGYVDADQEIAPRVAD
jgi:hypothetical protein